MIDCSGGSAKCMAKLFVLLWGRQCNLIGFHCFKDRHQDHPQQNHGNTDILGDCYTVELEGVVVADKLQEEAGDAVECEHEAKCAAGFSKEFSGIFRISGSLCSSPEEIKDERQYSTSG